MPIAVEVAKIVHGNPTLTAVLVVITGMLGARFGPWLMDQLAITNPISRGLALGTISHGQGTAQAATESELSGAIAGVAMGLGALYTSLAAPGLFRFLLDEPARAGMVKRTMVDDATRSRQLLVLPP